MKGRRVLWATVGAGALVVLSLVALLVWRLGSIATPPSRAEGSLMQAVGCWHRPSLGDCTPANTISSLPSQPTIVESDGQTVTWYSMDGQQWRTTSASETDVLRMFQNSGFTNYRIEATAVGGSSFVSVLLPNLILFTVMAIVIAAAVVAVVASVSRRSRPALYALQPPYPRQCSFCGRLDPGPQGLVRGPGASICGPCAQRAADQLAGDPANAAPSDPAEHRP